MSEHDASDDTPLLCARCGTELRPGTGDFYVVRIEAVADPSPPSLSDEDLKHDPRPEIERLIAQMRELSEQELVDQVYRRLILHLCGALLSPMDRGPGKMSQPANNLLLTGPAGSRQGNGAPQQPI